jgi:hypothetical protein
VKKRHLEIEEIREKERIKQAKRACLNAEIEMIGEGKNRSY